MYIGYSLGRTDKKPEGKKAKTMQEVHYLPHDK